MSFEQINQSLPLLIFMTRIVSWPVITDNVIGRSPDTERRERTGGTASRSGSEKTWKKMLPWLTLITLLGLTWTTGPHRLLSLMLISLGSMLQFFLKSDLNHLRTFHVTVWIGLFEWYPAWMFWCWTILLFAAPMQRMNILVYSLLVFSDCTALHSDVPLSDTPFEWYGHQH